MAPLKTIQLGTHKSSKDLRSELEKNGYQIGVRGGDILKKVKVAPEPTAVNLFFLSNAELGYPEGCTVSQTFEAGKCHGFETCPQEVGPQLFRQYTDRPMYEWLIVAMEPIEDSNGDLLVFVIQVDDEERPVLGGGNGDPDKEYFGDKLWVFTSK
jgi:hypothetical protein